MPRPKVPKTEEGPIPPAEGNASAEAGLEPAPTPETTPTTENLKIVITLKGDRGWIGVQREGCDPYLVTMTDAELDKAFALIPEMLAEATARWREQPRFPAYQRPAPPPAAPRPATPPVTRARRGAAQTPPAPPAPVVQAPRMF